MSRKDFIAAAAMFANLLETVSTADARRAVAEAAEGMADIFKRANGRFDRQRFRTACGLDPWNPYEFTS